MIAKSSKLTLKSLQTEMNVLREELKSVKNELNSAKKEMKEIKRLTLIEKAEENLNESEHFVKSLLLVFPPNLNWLTLVTNE